MGVIFFQFVLHQPIYWNVQATAFIVLVAVGADYNLLLITRIREESRSGIRSGIIRAVRSTGGVITSAGIIFAASMFGLLFGSLSTMVQTGFIIGMGLLIDTFVVRTVTVPAMAALVGKANWWPSKKTHATALAHDRRSTPKGRAPPSTGPGIPGDSLIGWPPTTSVVPRLAGGGHSAQRGKRVRRLSVAGTTPALPHRRACASGVEPAHRSRLVRQTAR